MLSFSQFTYHSNREVVVDDAVGNRISLLLLVVRDDVYIPAVQHHLSAMLNVPKDLHQATTLITCREQPENSIYFNSVLFISNHNNSWLEVLYVKVETYNIRKKPQ